MKKLLGGLLVVAMAAAALVTAPATASIALPHVVSDNPANVTPNVENDGVVGKAAVYALAQLGSTMYAGGGIHLVTNATRSTSYLRSNIFSFGATTGVVNAFAPDVNGRVWAIEPSGTSLYIGGYFTSVNGVPRQGIAKIDAVTGVVDPAFNAAFNSGAVQQVRLANGRLLVGGSFPKRLLALDPATGANTGYINTSITGSVPGAGASSIYRFDVSPDATRLVAVGNFTTVGGLARTRAFMLDLGAASATVSSWYYQPLANACAAGSLPAYLRDVDFSPDGKYFVIDSTGYVPDSGGIGRDLCDAAARFETNIPNPTMPTWINYTGGDTLHSVAVTGSVVYVQGHQRWLDNPKGRDTAGPGSVSRPGIGALDPDTGKTISWNPGKTRGVGGKDLLVTPAGLWVGSDGARFNGEFRKGIAFCPL